MDQLQDAVEYAARIGGAPSVVWPVDLDRSTVIPGSPGIYDGLVIAQWADQ
jgi:hypothetical protein